MSGKPPFIAQPRKQYIPNGCPAVRPASYGNNYFQITKIIEIMLKGKGKANKPCAEKPWLRLLSFDGGGVRGLSSLLVLQHLMETLNPDAPPKPCDFFHLIGGTSTGGQVILYVLVNLSNFSLGSLP